MVASSTALANFVAGLIGGLLVLFVVALCYGDRIEHDIYRQGFRDGRRRERARYERARRGFRRREAK